MNILQISILFEKLASHKVSNISENDLLGFDYSKSFKNKVAGKYPNKIINKMLDFGDLRLGLILKRLEHEEGLFNDWLEEYSKKYSPLGYYRDFDEPLEKRYGDIFDGIVGRI